MILLKEAKYWINNSSYDIAETVKHRLLTPDAYPLGSGRIEEFHEDPVMELLRADDISNEQKEQIAEGWKQAFNYLRDEARILGERPIGGLRAWTGIMRVAEATGYEGLKEQIKEALAIGIGKFPNNGRRDQQILSAALAYPDLLTKEFLEDMLNKENLAALAFNGLTRRNDVSKQDLVKYIEAIFERKIVRGWGIDPWFVAEYARKKVENNDYPSTNKPG